MSLQDSVLPLTYLSFAAQMIGLGLFLALIYSIIPIIVTHRPHQGFTVVELSERELGPKDSWIKQGHETIRKGVGSHSGPFQVMTGTGPKIVLPNKYAHELRNHDDLSLGGTFKKDFFGTYPGFEPFKGLFSEGKDTSMMPELVRTSLTQSLGLITNDLVDETTATIHDFFGEAPSWQEITLKHEIARTVARLSSRVFLGLPLCRNARWLQIAREYSLDAFAAARALRQIPDLVRPLAHWFMAPCIKLRQDYKDAQHLILPEIERRKSNVKTTLEAGEKPPKVADSIGWMYQLGQERQVEPNYVNGQLELVVGSIHTTTEALSTALFDCMSNPHIMPPLRKEIIEVIGAEGWSKQALYKLRLMDSCLKESQRLHPNNQISMNRLVKQAITLSDGTVLPTGSRLFVADRFRDPKVYANPDDFDPYRFLREREQPGQNNSWQYVTVCPEHMGFGYGRHACPGRFFVSTEIKIALAHLLLKYDWKILEESKPAPMWVFLETNSIVNPAKKVLIRRRKEEIPLDLPEPMLKQSSVTD